MFGIMAARHTTYVIYFDMHMLWVEISFYAKIRLSDTSDNCFVFYFCFASLYFAVLFSFETLF
jgi:hypothetical protein